MTLSTRTIEDLEAEILTRTRASLNAAGQECARSGHVWIQFGDERRLRKARCVFPVSLRPRSRGFEGWSMVPARVQAADFAFEDGRVRPH